MTSNKRVFIALLLIVCLCLALVACNDSPSDPQTPQDTYDGTAVIRLTAIGPTTIKSGKTVQIRASVTGTEKKDVVFSSSDETIATVNEKGLVTGLKAGTATIVCKLVEDERCKKSITVTVEQAVVPTEIRIEGAGEQIQWVEETLQLSIEVSPSDASALVDWTSSDTNVATVSASGLVSFVSTGNVAIKASSKEDASVSASVAFTVKKGVFRSDLGSPYWDIANQCNDENPHVSLTLSDDQAGYHSLYAANVSATRYYVEGSFRITKQISAWPWQGVGFGSGLSETSTRYFIFSPRVDGQGNTFNKFIVKDLPNETWGPITTRSQTWGENGLNDIDWANDAVKVALLRDNNKYYYLINDKLMYVDDAAVYDDVPTIPIMVAVDVCVDVSDYKIVTDNTEIDGILAQDNFKQSFYASNANIVDYESNDLFTFRSNTVMSKDNKVKSIGDSAILVGNFSVEFDVTDIGYNKAQTNAITGISLNLSRYESADTVDTFILGKSANQPSLNGLTAGFYNWSYLKSFEDSSGWYYWMESSEKVADDAPGTHHVKVTRTIENNKATFRMWVDDVEITFDFKSTQWDSLTTKYTGAYVLWIGGEYASGQITNLRFESNLDK